MGPAFSSRLGDAGFLGLTIPADYGGRGLGYLHRYVVTEELLAAWLAEMAGLHVPDRGPLTVAIAEGVMAGGRIAGTATDVPWPRDTVVVLAARTPDALLVAILEDRDIIDGRNLASEIERARAETTLAVTAATDRGFDGDAA